MFALCEQIDHFGGSFRGSQARANPVKDIWATLEGTIPQRLHSVCLPRCTCHIKLSLLKKLLRLRVFEEAFFCVFVRKSQDDSSSHRWKLFHSLLFFRGAAHDPARLLDVSSRFHTRAENLFLSLCRLRSPAVVAAETKPEQLPWLIDVKE